MARARCTGQVSPIRDSFSDVMRCDAMRYGYGMVYERHVPPVELGASSGIAAPAEPFRIVMRDGPYKPRLPRDRKLWPVVFSLLRVSTTILGSSLLQNLPRASRPMRERTADDVISPCHPLFLFISLVCLVRASDVPSFFRSHLDIAV